MRSSYLPLLILIIASGLNAAMMMMMSQMLNPRRPTPQKDMPYESGMIPLGDTRRRFTVKFFVFAIAFLVFDIETIFLIPWAVTYRELGVFGFIEGLTFVGILGVAFVYMWKKGALDWE